MYKHTIVANSVGASLLGMASNATGATWALTATSAADNLAHLITIRNDSATNHSAKTAILTGTDANGVAQTETLNLPAGSATVTSTKYFLTLTSVVPSATIGTDTMDIGWAAGSITPTNNFVMRSAFAFGFGCTVVSGPPTYTVQQTYDGTTWFDHATVAAETTSQEGSILVPVQAIRIKFTAAGAVTLTGWQAA